MHESRSRSKRKAAVIVRVVGVNIQTGVAVITKATAGVFGVRVKLIMWR